MKPLEARGLHRFYRRGDVEVAALLDVSITCEPGEMIAVTGPSGSGKSTLLSLLAGLDHPQGGLVLIDGDRMSHRDPTSAARLRARHVGVLTQSNGLFAHLSVRDNVRLAARQRRAAAGEADELIDSLGLGEVRNSLPRTLSGGETARASLAVALVGSPAVLLADEPTAEISSEEEHSVLDLLTQLRPSSGATVVVTHSDVVAAKADRRIALLDGRVVA